jgi:signal transduction histidine kinase
MEAAGQLIAGIAHDFNNLLTAILGNLELLSKRSSQDQERAERLIAGARTAAERGARLTAQLLAETENRRTAG